MMNQFFIFKQFLSFFAQAGTVHNAHSPFLYELAEQVLEDNRMFYVFQELEALRKKMLATDKELTMVDFGAGSKSLPQNQTRSLNEVARTSLITPLKAKWLFRMVNWLKPNTILEIGTSLGLSSLYMAGAATQAKIITLEGNPDSVQVAKVNFNIFPYGKNIEIVEGPFDQTLSPILQKHPPFDLVFLDGNHRKQPTIEYVNQLIPTLTEKSVIVLDDIYWSPGMKDAWDIIRELPEVTLSVDLFHFGLLFFRKEQIEKQHHIIAPKKWKPWVRSW